MKRILWIFVAVLFLTGCGMNEERETDPEVVVDPEIVGQRVYEEQGEKLTIRNCSECHGVNFDGKLGPALNDIGSEMTPEQIKHAILNGIGTMPKQNLTEEEAQAITDWLSKQKKHMEEDYGGSGFEGKN